MSATASWTTGFTSGSATALRNTLVSPSMKLDRSFSRSPSRTRAACEFIAGSSRSRPNQRSNSRSRHSRLRIWSEGADRGSSPSENWEYGSAEAEARRCRVSSEQLGDPGSAISKPSMSWVNLAQHCRFDALQGLLEGDVNLEVVPFSAQVAGDTDDVVLGLVLEEVRRHNLPENVHRLVLDRDVHVAQQIAGLFPQGIVHQHLLVDAGVGPGVG